MYVRPEIMPDDFYKYIFNFCEKKFGGVSLMQSNQKSKNNKPSFS